MDKKRDQTRVARPKILFVWGALLCFVFVPLIIAANSPLQAGRNIEYVLSSLAGILALTFLLMQPLLAARYLPGPSLPMMRRIHRIIGVCLILAVTIHIGGLYLTSAPDTLDALLLVAPTPFSVYGVIALWSVIITVFLVALRKRMKLKYSVWRIVHNALAVIIVISTIVHAVMIEGTMGQTSKYALCTAVLAATLIALYRVHLAKK